MQSKAYSRVGLFSSLVILCLWILFSESPFQKGGVSFDYYFYILLILFSIAFSVSLFYRLTFFERTIISTLIAGLAFIALDILFGSWVILFLYDGKTWFLWQSKERVLLNALFYLSNALLILILMFGYTGIRKLTGISAMET